MIKIECDNREDLDFILNQICDCQNDLEEVEELGCEDCGTCDEDEDFEEILDIVDKHANKIEELMDGVICPCCLRDILFDMIDEFCGVMSEEE
jgi:hypothetical protein